MSGEADVPAPVRLSVCIPAYKRVAVLPALLDSIVTQAYPHYEIVICEDKSPERDQIRAVAEDYDQRYPGRIRYFENERNLGFDANFREILRRATGDFCFIMGNDDLVAPGALGIVAEAIRRSPDVGVLLRSFASFAGTPDNIISIARYYPDELLLPPGPDTVVQFYRRSVVMSGIVLRREDSLQFETDTFDGTLFYQMHIIANILLRRPGLFVPEVLALYRTGNAPDFGVNERERGRFTPGQIEPAAGVRFLEGILEIAKNVDKENGTDLYRRIERDWAAHIYPSFATYANESLPSYARYYRDLCRLGFWRYPLFHAFALAVAVFGKPRLDRVLHGARRRFGYTPSLGERPRNAVVLRSPQLGPRFAA